MCISFVRDIWSSRRFFFFCEVKFYRAFSRYKFNWTKHKMKTSEGRDLQL
jgi:hypothetical protein